jgi:ABC transport system ATP-binding/permease protein
MAHLLNVESATVGFAGRLLLDAVSLGLDDGDRVGVVGRNGDGKSTLLRVLARRQEPDGGRVTHSRGLDLVMLTQTDELDPALDVRHAVVGRVPDHTWAADPAVREVLTGLLGGLDAPTVGGLGALVGGSPAGSAAGSRWRRPWPCPTTSCCSTSRPTTWTSRGWPGWPATCARAGPTDGAGWRW